MRYELPDKCPICQEKLHVMRLGCDNCNSILEGNFELDRLMRLSKDMRQFIITFLKYRGNIREMEKHYNISYPTVRSRIDEIVALLGEHTNADNEAEDKGDGGEISINTLDSVVSNETVKYQRLDILTKLSSGEIDIDEARALLDETNN